MQRRMHTTTTFAAGAATALALLVGGPAAVTAVAAPANAPAVAAQTPAAQAEAAQPITWTLHKVQNPSPDEVDAYQRIETAIGAAVARYARFSDAPKHLNVYYAPGVPTAEASYNGDVRFGSNRSFMNERTALHEISHTLGIGQTRAFFDRCAANGWPGATALLQEWGGPDARLNCGGGHIWPYGLNYDTEWSELNADRHVQLIEAMIHDGM